MRKWWNCCARAFLRQARRKAPEFLGAKKAFALVVDFLREWWEEGLFVPLYAGDSQLLEEEVSSASSKKHVFGSGVWRVRTEMDTEGRVWTGRGPDVVVANRVKALAKATWECMQQKETGVFDVKVRSRALSSSRIVLTDFRHFSCIQQTTMILLSNWTDL